MDREEIRALEARIAKLEYDLLERMTKLESRVAFVASVVEAQEATVSHVFAATQALRNDMDIVKYVLNNAKVVEASEK